MKLILKYKVEVLIFLSLVFSYFLLRLPNLTLQPIFADEAIYVRWAQVMKSEPTLRFLPLSDGKTPLFMWTLIPLFKVFSDPLFAGRFLSIIAGFFTLLGVFFLSKNIFNIKVALWASLLYVITPYTVFFDRMALVDSMLSAFTVWSIYFGIWLARSPRLDIAMILGFLIGGAILTKTPGMVNILILPITLLAAKRGAFSKYSYLRIFIYLAVAALIALACYNMLRLGPGFQQLSSRDADYVFAPKELIGRPLDPFIPHLRDMFDWFPRLFTIPTLTLIGLGIYQLIFTTNRAGLVVLIWILIPLILEMAFLKTFTARYLLTSVAPLLIFGGFGISKALEKIKINPNLKIIIALIAVLPLALRFDYQLLTSPPPAGLPKAERAGYFEQWTAGYGLKEIAKYIEEQKNTQGNIVVFTVGYFGTLPDGLQIYLDKTGIPIIGSPPTISDKVKETAKENATYFVGNKKELRGVLDGSTKILEFPKTSPSDKSEADATVLYQVLPE